MRARRVQRGILLLLLLTYLVFPGRVPGLKVSAHGLLLLAALFVHLAAARGGAAPWPYVVFGGAFLASGLLSGFNPNLDTVRGVGFGLLTAYLFASSFRGPASLRGVRWLAPTAVALAALTVLVFALPGTFTAGLGAKLSAVVLSAPLQRGAVLAACTVLLWASAARIGLPLAYGMLFLTFTALALTAMRAIWVGAIVAVFAFGLLHVRLRQLVLVMLLAFGAFRLVTWEAERVTTRIAAPSQSGQSLPASDAAAATPQSLVAADINVKAQSTNKVREELTSSGRIGYWMTGWRMLRARPLLGVGPGNFYPRSSEYAAPGEGARDSERGFDSHNILVAVAAETGVTGVAAFLVMVGWIGAMWCRSWRRALGEDHLRLAAVMAAFVGVSAIGLTWDLHLQRVWWIGLGLLHGASLTPSAADR